MKHTFVTLLLCTGASTILINQNLSAIQKYKLQATDEDLDAEETQSTAAEDQSELWKLVDSSKDVAEKSAKSYKVIN